MQLKHKNFNVVNVKVLDSAQGILEAIVSVFDVIDCYDERILAGFFAKSLKTRVAKGVWMHDWATPVAKTLVQEEWLPGDERLPEAIRHLGGLYIKGQFNLNTQRGREAFSDIEFGIIDEFSIGFIVDNSAYDYKTGIMDLIEGTLYEWSPVLVGANSATAVISVKNAGEGMLRRKVHELNAKGQIKLKAEHLGAGIEKWMTLAALDELNWALRWCIYDCLCDDAPLDERLGKLKLCYDEFRDIALRTIGALLNDGDAATVESVKAAFKEHLVKSAPVLVTGEPELADATETVAEAAGDAEATTVPRETSASPDAAKRRRKVRLLELEAKCLEL